MRTARIPPLLQRETCAHALTGVLYPACGLRLSLMIAAAAMSLGSVSVIANARRLRRSAQGR